MTNKLLDVNYANCRAASAINDYELTKLGRSLGKAVQPIGVRAQDHVSHIGKAQVEFDRKSTK